MASNSQLSFPHKASPITTDLGFFVRKDKAELPKMATPPSLNWKSAIDELTKGRDLVSELEAILPADTDTDLVREISGSFSRALEALKSEEKSKNLDTRKRKIESGQKGRPRKRTHSGSCTKIITTAMLNDGYSWRKYGQKTILNLKFPRCYFRCTSKYDQNCPAMRQVQQSEEDPSLYVITYIGEHTCQSSTAASLLMTSHEKKEASCIINFGTSNHSEDELKFPSPLLATRQEYSCEEGIGSTLSTHASSSSKYFAIMPELDTLEGRSTHIIRGGDSDVTSCLQPSKEDDDDLAWDYDFSDVFSFN